MRYAFFNADGWIDSAHNDDTVKILPDGAIALTDEQWESRFQLKLVNGDLTFATLTPLSLSVEEMINNRLDNINYQCEQTISIISSSYPASEVLSWPKQENEARAWLADNAATTPLIDALSSARGVGKADLVGRIIEKANLFAQVSGQLIGQRQALEDQLNLLLARHNDPENTLPVTQQEIEAITWPA
jgi:hypothetical protein